MFTPFWYLYFCLWTSRGFFFFFFLIKERSCTNKVLIFISESKFEAHFFSWLCVCLKLKLTCLFAKTSSTASLSSSSASILDSSSLASFTLSLSLLSTTKMSPAYKKQKQQKNTALKKKNAETCLHLYSGYNTCSIVPDKKLWLCSSNNSVWTSSPGHLLIPKTVK